MATIDKRIDLKRQFTAEEYLILHYFVVDTVDKIFQHIERLKIKRTGALKDSIKALVHTNAGGNEALVEFFYLNYGDCVEQAVGKYYGVDNDLGESVGVRSENIKAPEIQGVGYGSMSASFSNVPVNARREQTHRPRPFLRSEIRRQVDRISLKLMREAGMLIDIHIAGLIGDEIGGEIATMLRSPFKGGSTDEYEHKDNYVDVRSYPSKI